MEASRYAEIRQQMHHVFQSAFQWNHISQTDIVLAAQKLQVWKQNQLTFQEEEDRHVFFEYCFYEKLSPKGSQIELFASGLSKEDPLCFLAHQMRQSIHGLYQIVECNKEKNEVIIKDLLTKEGSILTLIDINLSHSNAIGLIFYGRLLPFQEVYISTGITFSYSQENLNRLLSQKEKIELKKRRKLSSRERYEWAYLSYLQYTRNDK